MVPANDIYAFIEEYSGKILRYWKYKKPGIVYDYGDGEEPGPYECETCSYGRLVRAYELPDGDLLLCFEDKGINDGVYQEFFKLSEVNIAYTDYDQEED